ncbi:MAG: hypothetical protein ABSH47_10820 [Bryobacteraceae bacterium]
MRTPLTSRPLPSRIEKGAVYCPICTHTVEVEILITGRSARVRDGQKCPRCGSSIGSAYVLYRLERAA